MFRLKKEPSRWAILAMGCLMFLFIGLLYAWSILSGPFSTEFGWTSAQLGMNYTILLISLSAGLIFASFTAGVIPARILMVITGVMFLAGYFISSFLQPGNLTALYLCYGVLIGVAGGFAYSTVLGVVIQHFLDKKGVASGILMMGMGISALVLGNLADLLFRSPLGWRNTYRLLGVLAGVVFVIGSAFMLPVREDETDDEAARADSLASDAAAGGSAGSSAAGGGAGRRQYTSMEMVATKLFYLLFFLILFRNFIYSGVTGHAKYIAMEAGVLAASAPVVVGLQSLANGLSRILWGWIYDKMGRKAMLIGDSVSFIVACTLLIVALSLKSPVIITVGIILIGFAYGGTPVSLSTLCEESFGKDNYSKNFSVINLGTPLAAFAAALSGSIQTASGSYLLAGLMMLLGAVVMLVMDMLFLRESVRLHGNRQEV